MCSLGGILSCHTVIVFFVSVNPFDLQRLSCDFTVYYIRSVGRVRMFIAITLKRYRAVKEVGKIKMSVGIIAYYQLMQVCQAEYFRQLLKPVT